MLGIIKVDWKKEKTTSPCCTKFLENGLTRHEVKCICHIHLQHHPIEMDIQSNLNIVHHHFTPTHNCQTKLMKWQMERIHINLMPLKNLDKAKSLATPRTQVMSPCGNNPWPHVNLVKLNEATSIILEVKCIAKMLKNHAKRSPRKDGTCAWKLT